MNFLDVINNLNGINLLDGKSCFICDRNNPQNYMEVSASLETHNDRQFVNTEFKVFNQGVQQQCDVFPHGKFTHYTRADGNNSTDQGEEHWEKMKQQMQEKGGFGDDLVFFPDVQSYQRFITEGQIEKPETVETPQQEQTAQILKSFYESNDSLSTNEVLERLMNERNENQTLSAAKQEDRVTKYNAQIYDLKIKQIKQNELISACNSIVSSKAFPALDPLIVAFSERLVRNNKKIDKKIKSTKKKLKNTKKRIKKINQKKKRAELLKKFISSALNPKSGKEEYIVGMLSLREDSLMRTREKFDRTTAQIQKMSSKLRKGGLTNTKVYKITSKLRTLQSKREKLEDRLNALNGLGEQLQKLANYEMVAEKVEMLKNTAVETAEKAAMSDSSLSSMIDTQTEASVEVVEKALHPDMSNKQEENTEAIESPGQDEAERTESVIQQKEPEKNSSFLKVSNVDESVLGKLFRAGIDYQVITENTGIKSVVFPAALLSKVREALAVNEQERNHQKGMKRE